MGSYIQYTRVRIAVKLAAAALVLQPVALWAASAQRAPFGKLADGTPIEAVTLTNSHGVSARIISYGATLQALIAPDRQGHEADIALGYDDLAHAYDLLGSLLAGSAHAALLHPCSRSHLHGPVLSTRRPTHRAHRGGMGAQQAAAMSPLRETQSRL